MGGPSVPRRIHWGVWACYVYTVHTSIRSGRRRINGRNGHLYASRRAVQQNPCKSCFPARPRDTFGSLQPASQPGEPGLLGQQTCAAVKSYRLITATRGAADQGWRDSRASRRPLLALGWPRPLIQTGLHTQVLPLAGRPSARILSRRERRRTHLQICRTLVGQWVTDCSPRPRVRTTDRDAVWTL